MGILSKLFGGRGGGSGGSSESAAEHAVLLTIVCGPGGEGRPMGDGFVERMHALQDRLMAAIEAGNAGELDGDEFGDGACVIYMYGADAERLWDAIAPVLEGEAFAAGSHAVKRYGNPGAREKRVDLAWPG